MRRDSIMDNIKSRIQGKRLWIYNIGRWQKDFEYVFSDLDIYGYIDDRHQSNTWQGKPLYTLQKYQEAAHEKNDLIIACGLEKDRITTNLNPFQYEKDYIWAEDFFPLFDEPLRETIGDRRIAIWGTGKYAEQSYKDLKDRFPIAFFVDNHPSSKYFHEYIIKHPSELSNEDWHTVYFLIANRYYEEIDLQLKEHSLQPKNDYCHAEKAQSLSKLFKQTWQANTVYELNCETMTNHLDIADKGEISPCCTTFLRMRLGKLAYQDLDEIWNSVLHKILCVSILNRTFTFCNPSLCPALINKSPVSYQETFNEHPYKRISKHARVTNIAIDYSCNLYCESCRDKICIAQEDEKKSISIVTDKIIDKVLPYTNFIMMAGNGEVFLSKFYERIWGANVGKKAKFFQILSNGTLFTRDKWEKFIEDRTSQILLCVSIDAATEKTYHILRRGGNWTNLMDNMDFAGELRQQGKISYFRLNFVVQKTNYQEIPAFIEMAKKFHADRVLFTQILNWGTYSKEDFINRTMVDENGLPKKELQAILSLPICQDPIVDIGTFRWQHNYTDTKKIKNYYLWEIDNYSNLTIEDMVLGEDSI